MILSMKWLGDYVKPDVAPREYSERMSLSGSKVEGWKEEGSEIKKVVVGQVLAMERHPDSDHLWVCRVDAGQESPLQIVTGAQNVREDDFVPVALHGSVLPGGKKITKGKLRGVESCGMLCSLGELGLTAHDFPYAIEDGIFILGDDCDRTVGTDIRAAVGLDDLAVEFEITSNRPDCLSVTGLARETAATFGLPFSLPMPRVKGSGGDIRSALQVEVRSGDLCPRYVARMAKNVKIGPSPRWMRERLRASGVRPINNIVDITNYVMLEYGQPMHAFDLRQIGGAHIIVRNAAPGEEITTLDGVRRVLSPEMLVIADENGPTAVAGVMGGEYSEIEPDTTAIVFESACFNGASVRRTSKKLGLRTEASGRYEKGLDPATCPLAADRACELVELLGAGEVVDGVIDVDHSDHTQRRIPFDPDWINRFIGIRASRQEMEEILSALDIRVEGDTLIPPSYRADLEHKADIAEEVARIYGYGRIPTTGLRGLAEGALTPRQVFDRKAERTLLSLGYSEIMTYSFISPKLYDRIRLPQDSPLRNSLVIKNPLGEDTSIMRTTALPSMLQTLSLNYNNRNPKAALYEAAVEYLPTEPGQLPYERASFVLGAYGKDFDFYTLKGAVETLLNCLGVTGCEYLPCTDNAAFHPGRCALLVRDGKNLGLLGEIHPAVCENFEMDTRVYAAHLDADLLFKAHSDEKHYTPLPKFPASARDLALLCDDALPVAELEKVIRKKAGSLLEALELFDVYRGSQIPEGKKSVAYSMTLRSADHTLTVEECDKLTSAVLAGLEEIGVRIRG